MTPELSNVGFLSKFGFSKKGGLILLGYLVLASLSLLLEYIDARLIGYVIRISSEGLLVFWMIKIAKLTILNPGVLILLFYIFADILNLVFAKTIDLHRWVPELLAKTIFLFFIIDHTQRLDFRKLSTVIAFVLPILCLSVPAFLFFEPYFSESNYLAMLLFSLNNGFIISFAYFFKSKKEVFPHATIYLACFLAITEFIGASHIIDESFKPLVLLFFGFYLLSKLLIAVYFVNFKRRKLGV
ncbi:hypothetical protein SAMN06298216_1017 [Spirosomataceae bacterium TFI 002]|nr:hypothetical protein SAMN06298216_1017 [Spirosomataceae bacterium TFI 002]